MHLWLLCFLLHCMLHAGALSSVRAVSGECPKAEGDEAEYSRLNPTLGRGTLNPVHYGGGDDWDDYDVNAAGRANARSMRERDRAFAERQAELAYNYNSAANRSAADNALRQQNAFADAHR